jgi:hypothetical protein
LLGGIVPDDVAFPPGAQVQLIGSNDSCEYVVNSLVVDINSADRTTLCELVPYYLLMMMKTEGDGACPTKVESLILSQQDLQSVPQTTVWFIPLWDGTGGTGALLPTNKPLPMIILGAYQIQVQGGKQVLYSVQLDGGPLFCHGVTLEQLSFHSSLTDECMYSWYGHSEMDELGQDTAFSKESIIEETSPKTTTLSCWQAKTYPRQLLPNAKSISHMIHIPQWAGNLEKL